MPVLPRLFAATLALLVLGASASPAAVLCVADDGHLALKEVTGPCSHPATHHHHHGDEGEHGHAQRHGHGHGHADGPRHGHGDGHGHADGHGHGHEVADEHGCHPCVDVPLRDTPPAASAPSFQDDGPTVLALPVAGHGLHATPLPPVRRLTAPLPRPPLLLRSLRTVVLTC